MTEQEINQLAMESAKLCYAEMLKTEHAQNQFREHGIDAVAASLTALYSEAKNTIINKIKVNDSTSIYASKFK